MHHTVVKSAVHTLQHHGFVFIRTAFQQRAVKCLEEVEPFSAWHKTAEQANGLATMLCQVPGFSSGVPRAPWTHNTWWNLFLWYSPFVVKWLQACLPISKQALGDFRNNSPTIREEKEQLLITGKNNKISVWGHCLGASNLSYPIST